MKTFFNTKSIRERVLMTALLLIAVLLWGSSLLGRSRTVRSDWAATAEDIKEQQTWLGKKSQVKERTEKITTLLVPSRTYNATQALAEINRLAQGLSPDIGAPRTDHTENFDMHSLQVTFRKIGLESLLKFYQELSKKVPYLGIDNCSISSDRAAPGQVNAVFRIYSVEVLPTAKP